ncbi:GAF domain-containing protein [Paenarthrobacter nitroguajacolicus]|uniref:GAF domain-containing protein n=1 Tax=Paenarthrobacter nitroguajacolicus TaxID=211146 RepID=A0A558GWN9_PAENT|nr:GAF domain-containing protein [Paenarthrobacter nitroguajacolicus]TVU61293.1 GAF domain-containing protein [Paenarthrobacter nitroguajacolicus]
MKERSDRTAERLRSWLKALGTVGAAVNGGISLDELLNMVSRTASELMGYDFCSVTVPDANNTVLVISGSYGLSEDYIREVNALHPIRLQGMSIPSPSTQAFKLGIPIQIEDTATNPSFVPWAAAAQRQGFSSMIAVPIAAPNGTLGTLNCFTRRRHPFTSEEVSLLTILADQVAIAISTANLRAEQARAIVELTSLNKALEEQYTLQRQVADVHRHLTSLALGGGGIEDVGTALAELLKRPVVVRSDQDTVMCGPENDARSLMDGLKESAARPALPNPSPALSDVELPLPDGSSVPAVSAPVVIRDEVVATIWTTGALSGLTPLERHAMEHAATVMALEFLHARSIAESVWHRSGQILSGILLGSGPSPSVLFDQARRLGHDLAEPHAVIVTRHDRVSESELQSRLTSVLTSRSGGSDPRPFMGAHKDYVIALWPVGSEPLVAARAIADEIRLSLSERGTLQISAVAGPASDPAGYVESFATARGAAELGRLRGISGQTLLLNDLGMAAVFLQGPDTARLRSYCEEVLGPLQRYDAAHGTALIHTLSVLLHCDLDAHKAAAQLSVHTSTILRRRRLIEDTLGREMTNVAALTSIAAALQLEEILAVTGAQGLGQQPDPLP